MNYALRHKPTKSEKHQKRMKIRPYSKPQTYDGPIISCIIYTYNRAAILPRAILSVANQTFKDYEMVIVDDCSTDDTKEVVEALRRLWPWEAGKIKYFRNETNLGSSRNKNVGIEKAKGRYIVILDDDNEFAPTYFQESLDLLINSSPQVGGVRVGRKIIQKDYIDYAPVHTGPYDSIDWGFMMKREVFDELKYDPLCRGDEDADFGIQFAKKWKSLSIEKPLLICYAKDEGSNCAPTPERLAGLEYFLKKNIDFYKQDANELRYIYRLAGRNFYKAGQKLKGLKYFLLSFLAKQDWKTFKHLFFICFGWRVYDWYMDSQERKTAKQRCQRYEVAQ